MATTRTIEPRLGQVEQHADPEAQVQRRQHLHRRVDIAGPLSDICNAREKSLRGEAPPMSLCTSTALGDGAKPRIPVIPLGVCPPAFVTDVSGLLCKGFKEAHGQSPLA
jgi:hypothetical protein